MMKYKVGDLVLIKHCEYKLRRLPRLHPRLHLHSRPHPHLRPHLLNTFGIITAVEKHTEISENDSTEKDNGYIWFSQVDGKEYYFYENEVIGEVVE